MSENNTKGIGKLLTEQKLDYLPEAHCYLKHKETLLDITGLANSENHFQNDLLHEEVIEPNQVVHYKIEMHKSYIKKWITDYHVPFTFEDIWKLREQCIANLSA